MPRPSLLQRLWAMTIWHPDAIDPEEWKFRNLMRVWLPVYDLLAIMAGIWAYLFGSPILHKLFPGQEGTVDVLGLLLVLVSIVCLVGVTVPRIPRLETWGKLVLVGLLSSYAGAIVVFNANGDTTSWFVAFVVGMTLPMPLFRLGMLGEETKERRAGGAEDAEREDTE